MINTVCDALDYMKFRYDKIIETNQKTVFKFGIGLENGKVDTFVDVRTENHMVIIYSIFTLSIPENKRKAIAEFLTMANYGLLLGNFEMDMNDGELRYKCCYIYDPDQNQSEEMFLHYLVSTFRMVEKYLPGIMSVVYANADPGSMIKQIENGVDPGMN